MKNYKLYHTQRIFEGNMLYNIIFNNKVICFFYLKLLLVET
jgi:hypothetical protein